MPGASVLCNPGGRNAEVSCLLALCPRPPVRTSGLRFVAWGLPDFNQPESDDVLAPAAAVRGFVIVAGG